MGWRDTHRCRVGGDRLDRELGGAAALLSGRADRLRERDPGDRRRARADLIRDLFYASARSLQIGLAIEVIAITSVAANLAAILGGILVFGEPVGSGAVGIIARLLAFGLVIAGAALVLAPLRATSTLQTDSG
jgi:hypothetical protein